MPRGKKRRLSIALHTLSKAEPLSKRSLEDGLEDSTTEEDPNDGFEGRHLYKQLEIRQQLEDTREDIRLAIPSCSQFSELEMVLIAQALNLVPTSFLSWRLHYVGNIVSYCMDKMYAAEEICSLAKRAIEAFSDNIQFLQIPKMELLCKVTLATQVPHTAFLGPPTTSCLVCSRNLSIHNDPSTVVLFGLHGPMPALKITLRCDTCMLNYR